MTRKLTKKIRQQLLDHIQKHDLCCEEDYNRPKIIAQLFRLYGEIGEADHYDGNQYLAIDLLRLFGFPYADAEFYKVERKLWKKDKYDKTRITEMLHEIPLVYLMALLGRAYFRHSTKTN
jgi:hypothetical protein